MNNFKKYFFATLDFLNVLDFSKKALSITNVAVWIVVIKIATLSNLTLPAIGAFVIAMLNYAHKRNQTINKITDENKSVEKLIEDTKQQIESQIKEVSDRVSTVVTASGLFNRK